MGVHELYSIYNTIMLKMKECLVHDHNVTTEFPS